MLGRRDNGSVAYKPLSAKGDRIVDFSYASDMGGVALPTVAVKQTVSPAGGDDTSAIANAIAAVSALLSDRLGPSAPANIGY